MLSCSGFPVAGTAPPAGEQYIVFKQNHDTYNFEGYNLEKVRIAGQDFFIFTVTSGLGVPWLSTASDPDS